MAKKSKPRIVRSMKKNMYVKCPHCGWSSSIPKTDRAFSCKKCHQSVDLEKEYKVDKYY